MEGFNGALESRVGAFSYQSPMPAGAGTPGYENETWSLEVFGCGWRHPPLWIPASARMTNSVAGDNYFRNDRSPGAGTPRYEKARMAWHSVLARRILPRPTPTPAGDKPPRYIPPPHPWPPVLYRGTGARQPACPGRSLAGRRVCHSPLRPGRFANRPYNDVCLWWDAWLGGLLGHEHDDRSNCKGARSDVDEAGVLNQPG